MITTEAANPSYFPNRKCDSCGAAMSPWVPRRRRGEQLLCWGCHSTHKDAASALPPNHEPHQHYLNKPPAGSVGDYEFALHDMLSRLPEDHPDHPRNLMKRHMQQAASRRTVTPAMGQPNKRDHEFEAGTPPFLCKWCHKPKDHANHEEWIGQFGSSLRVAHDSGDGETIYHCPFCGSGAVTGSGDGTVSCDYCKTNFTVQVQPEYSAFPQTVDGQPFDVPGMPDGSSSTQPGVDPDNPMDTGEPDETAFDKGEQQQAEETAAATQAAEDQLPDFLKNSHFITRQGAALPTDAYVKHLAIAFADDPREVLAAVRADNQKG